MSTKKVAICGYYGYGNTGDEAILAAIIQSIKERCDVEITVFSGNPKETIEKHGVNAVYISELRNLHSILKTVYGADLLIIGGGGIIHDLTYKNFKFWLNKIVIGEMFRKPIVLYAPGVGPIKTTFGKMLTKHTLSSVEAIHVRNKLSKEVLVSSGVNESLIQVTSDPVMALTPANSRRVEEILDREGICTEKPLVGISVRWNPYEYRFDSEFVENFIEKK
ncbi:polysaccharide pyruvyl transferase family protein [Methanosarcina horonobensis]|uniref:polysaccharide pyruvyl transferase family protein n=1 Tax=Methanosarcina horonobensis TaxID=418008 RepID=UPI000AE25758|nr:polysaccharide pyruvyl transferase family protein [Methanosarcina horonobensis]